MAKKVTTRRDEMRRTTLGVIRAPLRVHCVVTHLLLAHAAILYVTRLSNKTAINRTVRAAHAHISFDVSWLYTPPMVMDSCYITESIHFILLFAAQLYYNIVTKFPIIYIDW